MIHRQTDSDIASIGIDILAGIQKLLPDYPNYRKIVNLEFIISDGKPYVTELNTAVNMGHRLKFFLDIDTILSITDGYDTIELILSKYEKDTIHNPEDELIKYLSAVLMAHNKVLRVAYVDELWKQAFTYDSLESDVFYFINCWFGSDFDMLCSDKSLFYPYIPAEYKIGTVDWSDPLGETVIIKQPSADRATGIDIKTITNENIHSIQETHDKGGYVVERFLNVDTFQGRKIELVPYYYVSKNNCEFSFKNFEYFTQYTAPVTPTSDGYTLNGFVPPYSGIIAGSMILTPNGIKSVESLEVGDEIVVARNKNIPKFGLAPYGNAENNWWDIKLNDSEMLDMETITVNIDSIFENITYGYYIINNEFPISEAHFMFSNLGNIWRLNKTDRLNIESKLLINSGIVEVSNMKYIPTFTNTYAICTSDIENYSGDFINVNGYWVLSV